MEAATVRERLPQNTSPYLRKRVFSAPFQKYTNVFWRTAP